MHYLIVLHAKKQKQVGRGVDIFCIGGYLPERLLIYPPGNQTRPLACELRCNLLPIEAGERKNTNETSA